LIKQLEGIWEHPLTVLEAPMGYGKTTAVKHFLASADADVLWLKVYDDSIDVLNHFAFLIVSNINLQFAQSRFIRKNYYQTADTLGDLGDERVVEPLIEALGSSSCKVSRRCAAEALGKIGDRTEVEF